MLGARFVCMARVEGEVPADNPGYHGEGWMPALDEAGQRRVWESGLDTMAAIHRLDRAAVGLGWIGDVTPDRAARARSRVPHLRVRRRARTRWSTAPSSSSRPRVPPPSPRPALCWGDSRIGNMIFGADQRVAAVLDWEMVTAGDPVQDLAWYLLLDHHHTMAFDVPRLPGSRRARSPSRGGRRRAATRPRTSSGTSCSRAARYASVMVRVMKLLDSTGVFPGAAESAFDQTGTRLLAEMLDERY